jgi:hypothetical protein
MATGTAWDNEAPGDASIQYTTNDAPTVSAINTAQGTGDTNGKRILNLACATVMGALALLWLFGGVLMKDARL